MISFLFDLLISIFSNLFSREIKPWFFDTLFEEQAVIKKTISNKFQNTSISTKGRHDPCVGLRAVPIAEAMMACVLADHILRNRAQCG